MKRTLGSKISEILLNIFMALLVIVTLNPFWHVLMYSISDPELSMGGGLFLYPRGFSLDGYEALLENRMIFNAYANSIFVTVVGTLINVLLTTSLAYPLSVKRFKGRSTITLLIFLTIIFQSGMIPNYLLVDALNLLDTFWALLLPTAINAWNLIIMKNYFQSIPPELEESASLDGASPLTILVKIIIPVSLPVIATVTLFYAVIHWNSYFNAVLYISSQSKQILPVFLRVLLNASASTLLSSSATQQDTMLINVETLKMATVVASVVPMLIVYPFIQKYYVKGIMVGSIKG